MTRYRSSRMIENWKTFKGIIKKTKCLFFDDKILEIALRNKGLWDLINWVKRWKLQAMEVLQYNRYPCIELNELW